MKKKLLATLLCAAMGVTLLAGCGTEAEVNGTADAGTTDAGTADAGTTDEATADAATDEGAADAASSSYTPYEGTIKIGVELYDPSDDQTLAMQAYFDYLEENMDIEFVYSEALADASAELDFINSCAAAGCQGIFGYYNLAEGEVVKTCESLGMYYWGTDSIYEEFKTNPYYTGCYGFAGAEDGKNGDYIGGYQLAYSLGQAGVKHVFYCNGGASMGIPMFVDRQNGFIDGIAAANADGYEIAYDPATDVVEGWPDAPDFATAVGAKIAGDYDGAAASFNAAALFQPLGEAGKLGTGEFKLATIGEVCDTYLDFVNAGTVASVVYDCEEVVFCNAVVSLVNAISGNRLTDADGNALKTMVHRWVVNDADTYNKIYNFHNDGNFFVPAEDVKSMLGATGEAVNTYYEALTVENAVAGL